MSDSGDAVPPVDSATGFCEDVHLESRGVGKLGVHAQPCTDLRQSRLCEEPGTTGNVNRTKTHAGTAVPAPALRLGMSVPDPRPLGGGSKSAQPRGQHPSFPTTNLQPKPHPRAFFSTWRR